MRASGGTYGASRLLTDWLTEWVARNPPAPHRVAGAVQRAGAIGALLLRRVWRVWRMRQVWVREQEVPACCRA